MKFGDLKDKLGNVKDKVTATAGNLKETGGKQLQEKLSTSLQELNDLRPLLNECGFIIGDIKLTASVPPSVGIVVEQEKEGQSNLQKVMEKKELTRLQSIVLGGIRKIYDLNNVVEKHDHTIGQIEIEMGIPPKVIAHLNSTKSRAFAS